MVTETETPSVLSRKDFVSEADIRWCPGCGDYAILNAIQRVFPTLGIPRENFVIVSGIGCSSRFPYYMETYGFHSIHGRAPTLATGIKAANPDLSVWVITGDGDGLSIGGNHLMHILRRNPDINILMFNNKIYGLTKGQYSPTTEVGHVTKTSPMGSIDHPINPVSFALASQATFVARTVDTNPKHMATVFTAAAKHKGVSFVEVMQNCVIFNDNAWMDVSGRDVRDDRMVILEDGQPLLFGKDKTKGIRFNGMDPEVVTIGENDVTIKDIVVHRENNPSSGYAYILSHLNYPEFPVPMGVFRAVESSSTYEQLMVQQIKDGQKRQGRPNLAALLKGNDFWEVTDTTTTEGIKKPRVGVQERSDEMKVMAEQIQHESVSGQDLMTRALRSPIDVVVREFNGYAIQTMQDTESVAKAISLFKTHDIGALAVLRGNEVAGIVSERDMLTRVVLKPMNRDNTPVSSIMTQNPDVISSQTTIGAALNRLSIGNYRHLLISDEKDGVKRLGLISSTELLGHLAEQRSQTVKN